MHATYLLLTFHLWNNKKSTLKCYKVNWSSSKKKSRLLNFLSSEHNWGIRKTKRECRIRTEDMKDRNNTNSLPHYPSTKRLLTSSFNVINKVIHQNYRHRTGYRPNTQKLYIFLNFDFLVIMANGATFYKLERSTSTASWSLDGQQNH